MWMIGKFRAVFLGVAMLVAAGACAQETSDAKERPDFLILPVVNYSEKGEARTQLLPRLHEYLDRIGTTYLTSEELRPLLRKHRIRSRGWIGLEAEKTLRRETGASYLMLGAWDVFREGANPEIGVSLRILDLESLTLVDAVSVGASGADFTGLLGLGRITDTGELAEHVMKQALDALFPVAKYQESHRSSRGCFQVALIPFDNYADTPNAGDIVTNIVLSGLLSQGYFVVEPGFVRELGLELEVINRGGVDRRSGESILDRLNTCQVITGTVDEFSTARGDPTRSVPQIALGIRVMSPQDGNIYLMQELQGAGDDQDRIFQGGRIHAIVPLANKVLQNFLTELVDNNREDILHGNPRP